MIEHQCEYRFTALIHTDACLEFIYVVTYRLTLLE